MKSKSKKLSLIILITAISAVVILVVTLSLFGAIPWGNFSSHLASMGMYGIKETDIVFDYIDASVYKGVSSTKEYRDMLEINHFGGHFPYFGNPLTLESGMNKNWSNDASRKNEPIYQAIYDPLYAYAIDMAQTYDNLVDMQYSVENDGKTITVVFNNKAYPNGTEAEPMLTRHVFIYNIEGASLDNLPVLDDNSVKLVEPLYEKYYFTTYEELRNSYKKSS